MSCLLKIPLLMSSKGNYKWQLLNVTKCDFLKNISLETAYKRERNRVCVKVKFPSCHIFINNLISLNTLLLSNKTAVIY